MLCRLRGCGKCGGDLLIDESDWKCCQCGHIYYANPGTPLEVDPSYLGAADGGPSGPNAPGGPSGLMLSFNGEEPEPRRRGRGRIRGKRTRSSRSLNSLIQAKTSAEARWWARHQPVIECLDRGMAVRDICSVMDLGPRQVRAVRERLADIRAEAVEIV